MFLNGIFTINNTKIPVTLQLLIVPAKLQSQRQIGILNASFCGGDSVWGLEVLKLLSLYLLSKKLQRFYLNPNFEVQVAERERGHPINPPTEKKAVCS